MRDCDIGITDGPPRRPMNHGLRAKLPTAILSRLASGIYRREYLTVSDVHGIFKT